jgi:phospholipid/cholesterol/gamma-HCH transport system ATP-binding protein
VPEISSIADYTYLIAGGKVVAEGTPKDLEQDGTAVVKQFISGAPDGPVPFHYPAEDYFSQLLKR